MKNKVILLSILLGCLFSYFYISVFSIASSDQVVYVCQVGIFSNESNASDMVNKMTNLSYDSYRYLNDGKHIVIAGISLSNEEANEIGTSISASGMNCVIKQYNVSSECIELIKEGTYTMLLEELAD